MDRRECCFSASARLARRAGNAAPLKSAGFMIPRSTAGFMIPRSAAGFMIPRSTAGLGGERSLHGGLCGLSNHAHLSVPGRCWRFEFDYFRPKCYTRLCRVRRGGVPEWTNGAALKADGR